MKDRRNFSGTKYYVIRFQADIVNLKRVIGEALEYYERSFNLMDEDTRLELKIVLNELLINAVKHGSKAGAVCYVKLIAGMIADDCALLIVEDDGDGYDTSAYKNRDGVRFGGELDDIEETGRGIYLVKNLCEDFMVNEKGNKVVINKKLRRTVNV